MHVTSYGVSVTTLEEVFLKVASDATDHKNLGHLGQLRRESSASVMDASQGAEKDQVSRLPRSGHHASVRSPHEHTTCVLIQALVCLLSPA